jgi:hypothetical protein
VDRLFFRYVLEMQAVDVGGGWLVFALPPSELACHPAEENDKHEFYLMCDDPDHTMGRLESHGIRCDEPFEESRGIRTEITLPGGGKLGLYQRKHVTAF